jgi:hypothetical protein
MSASPNVSTPPTAVACDPMLCVHPFCGKAIVPGVSSILMGPCPHRMHYECGFSLRKEALVSSCPACQGISPVKMAEQCTGYDLLQNFGDSAGQLGIFNGCYNMRALAASGDITRVAAVIQGRAIVQRSDDLTPTPDAPLLARLFGSTNSGGDRLVLPNNDEIINSISTYSEAIDIATLIAKSTRMSVLAEKGFTATHLLTARVTAAEIARYNYSLEDLALLPGINWNTMLAIGIRESILAVPIPQRSSVLERLTKAPYNMTFALFLADILNFTWKGFSTLKISANELKIIGFNSTIAQTHGMDIANWKYFRHLKQHELTGPGGIIDTTYWIRHQSAIRDALGWNTDADRSSSVPHHRGPRPAPNVFGTPTHSAPPNSFHDPVTMYATNRSRYYDPDL